MVMGEASRGSCRPTSPSLQEGVLKAGWLKKQRSIMKNWQLRWFVLRADHLYFYKDEEETKPQGCISLKGSQVNELTANPEEPGRHLFEIVPAGEKDKAAMSHESFLLMANSQSDMDDWVKAIRRVIWAPFGGGIFGQRLEDTVQYERKFGPRLAPLLVEQCVDFIREQGLDEEGLFRMPGQANLVKELQEAFDCGDKPQFDSNTDVHTVASLLKLYLRELPEPVVPFCKYEDFLTCAQILAKDEEENLATVFGPNILRPKMEDPVAIMEGTSLVQHLMTLLISKHDRLYTEKDLETSQNQTEVKDQSQQLQQSNLVDWISEEDLHTCPPAAKNDPTSSSASSVDAASASKPVPQGKGETAISPSKQAKTIPGWKYTFKGSSPRPQSAKAGGSAVDVSTASSGNWLMNGLSSLRGHRRTSSGERSRDSGSSQRLSTYDNVTSSSSLGSVLSMDSTPWSTSSCEISVPDSGSEPLGTEDGPQTEASAQEERSEEDGKSSEQEDADSAVEKRASGLFCSDNGNVAPVIRVVDEDGDADESSSSLVNVVAELKEELKKQKQTYESRIKKQEESSAALCVQMERLEQEMEQERKRKRMLEIKLRNSERAREDAENRNRLLEKEMEDFFSTLGDLALGSRTSDI
ncbi:rho GTPase-activating 22-like protein [Labeo rohita]|uniref:Rho GTPase-activating 22-like protein n=1 Tax=Labeo rohita TaxID=84645 RepID=A0A498NAX4_LABRO|nr:rho GTPase-activating 22-like protein [Labeo rohita]